MKYIYYGKDARQRILTGAKVAFDTVKVTYGPKGQNVGIKNQYTPLTITHDGVTVLESIANLPTNKDNLGYEIGLDLIKQGSSKLNLKLGNGTTTVAILNYHLQAIANKYIDKGYNPMLLRAGMEQASKDVLTILSTMGHKINNNRLKQVATISASGDEELGQIVYDVMKRIGKDGTVTVETSNGTTIEKEFTEGYSFDRGFLSQFFTNNDRQEAVIDNPTIVIFDQKLSTVTDIMPLFERLSAEGKKDLLIISNDISDELLNVLVSSKIKGVFNSVAVKSPSFGQKSKNMLYDIAAVTGTQVIGDKDNTIQSISLGSAKRIVVTKDKTTIIGGIGKTKAYIKSIKGQEDDISRIATIEGKVAIIKVGGLSESEIDEKKYRLDDAVADVKAAMAEGIVAGGGCTLVGLANYISIKKRLFRKLSPNQVGYLIVKQALQQPFLQLMDNAAIDGKKYLSKIRINYGIDVMQPELGIINLIDNGVIDPIMVTKEVISTAISIAATAITMGAIEVEK